MPRFLAPGTHIVGGEVDGQETLPAGEYIVKRDINVRPGGKLTLQPGVTLRFPPAVGIMVAGKLDAHGTGPSNILMTLKEEIVVTASDNDTMLMEMDADNAEEVPSVVGVGDDSRVPVRLLGGKTAHEGRLQVRSQIIFYRILYSDSFVFQILFKTVVLEIIINPIFFSIFLGQSWRQVGNGL